MDSRQGEGEVCPLRSSLHFHIRRALPFPISHAPSCLHPILRSNVTDCVCRNSLAKLREKLKEQRAHLDELDKHIKELEAERGGEQ